jgi:hypothetical protein
MKSASAICRLTLCFLAAAVCSFAAVKKTKSPYSNLTNTLLECASLLGGPVAKRNFLVRQGVIANLPEVLPMGYAVNHRYYSRMGAHTIFSAIPLPGRRSRDRLLDFARFNVDTPIPKRFVIGDGQSHRALIGVDLNPGSPLSKQVQRIRKTIQWARGNATKQDLIELISQNIANQLGPVIRTADQRRSDQPALPWDGLAKDAPVTELDFTRMPVDHDAIPGRFNLPIVPLEEMIAYGESYCLGQAVLAWILLRDLGIPSRLLLGANATTPDRYIGHTSVELGDGRIVDPAGWLVIPAWNFSDPIMRDIDSPTPWRFMRGFSSYIPESPDPLPTWRFRYSRYLALVLENG